MITRIPNPPPSTGFCMIMRQGTTPLNMMMSVQYHSPVLMACGTCKQHMWVCRLCGTRFEQCGREPLRPVAPKRPHLIWMGDNPKFVSATGFLWRTPLLPSLTAFGDRVYRLGQMEADRRSR